MAANVLIVLDGSYRFGEMASPLGARDFTYVTLVDTLTNEGMTVTKAHRSLDSTATLNFTNFRFDVLPAGHSLAEYDMIWLIGFDGLSFQAIPLPMPIPMSGALPDAEINAIANYMDNGGGVFATGDHFSIGAVMCGKLPRVRAMRCWYGDPDPASPMPAGFPRNYPPLTSARADTTQSNLVSNYTEFPTPPGPQFIWFENQSDAKPQIIAHNGPTHEILRNALHGNNGHPITVYPDHMHEGHTQGEDAPYDFTLNSPYGDTSKAEFRTLNGHRELPHVIATGQVLANASRQAKEAGGEFSFASFDPTGAAAVAATKPVNTLSVYDGRTVGVGRIVTGATFHHYVDINLTGDSTVTTVDFPTTTVSPVDRVGESAQKNRGFNDDPLVFNDIKAVFINITNWLARPKPTIQLILERSTFSQDEVGTTLPRTFTGVVLMTVDGLKPNQFPGGPIDTLTPTPAQLDSWAPAITVAAGYPIEIKPIGLSSDDPSLPDRLQRFTFRYRVTFTGPAYGFDPEFQSVQVDAALAHPAVLPTALTDRAWLMLVKAANPYMLDLADGSGTNWLSSDVRTFRVVEGNGLPDVPSVSALPANATIGEAQSFIRNIVGAITPLQFTALDGINETTTLSALPRTTGGQKVYNFVVARVRLDGAMATANDVRVYFRIFASLTTAALTYQESAPGVPIGGYLQTIGGAPIALPSPNPSGSDWFSFPFFAETRQPTPSAQGDGTNVKTITTTTGDHDFFFGALIDNNLDDPYPGLIAGASPQPTIRSLLPSEHQCLVAQIEFAGAPIPSGANPGTSDKLAQRNLAVSAVANPGLDASRVAMHSFEIEATPHPITDALRPDELLLDWTENLPDGTMLRLHIPSWQAREVVALADKLYPRHDIEAIDDHSIEMPGGGTRYVPIPKCLHRQTGVISVEFPLGIRKGQRFDISVRQVSTRHRKANVPPPNIERITLEEAEKILQTLPGNADHNSKGAFDLGNNKSLLTDLSVLDAVSDHALIIEHPDPALVRAAIDDSGHWRETIGAFQLGVPVSTKSAMVMHEMRILSLMRWRLAHMSRNDRWRKTMLYYVGLLSDKVQALGGNPFEVPATPDGAIPQLPWVGGDDDDDGGGDGSGGSSTNPIEDILKRFAYPWGCLLLILLLLIIIWLALS